MKLETAINTIKKALKEDKGYRESWKANIAVAFQDEFGNWRDNNAGINASNEDIHKISNIAANRFLEKLAQ